MQTIETKRCGQCGNEIPGWSGGVCPVCERLSSGEKRFWKGGKKRPRPRQARDQPAPPSPVRPIQQPTTKPAGPVPRPQPSAPKRPLGKQTQGRRRLDNFNQLLQEIYSRPVRFGHLLAKQGIPPEQINRWRQDGIWLLRFLKRLHQELLTLLAKAHPDQDPQVLTLWYSLDGKESQPIETIATELKMTTADVRTARRTQLRYLRGEQGQATFERSVLTAAKSSSPSLP